MTPLWTVYSGIGSPGSIVVVVTLSDGSSQRTTLPGFCAAKTATDGFCIPDLDPYFFMVCLRLTPVRNFIDCKREVFTIPVLSISNFLIRLNSFKISVLLIYVN